MVRRRVTTGHLVGTRRWWPPATTASSARTVTTASTAATATINIDGGDGDDILEGDDPRVSVPPIPSGNDEIHGGDGDDTIGGGPRRPAVWRRPATTRLPAMMATT